MAPKKTSDADKNSDTAETDAKKSTAKSSARLPKKTSFIGESAMSETATAESESKSTPAKDTKHLVRGKFEPYTPTPDEDYMSAAQLEHFKLILNDWKQELMNEVDRTVDHMKDESANLPDPADRATQEEEFSLELRTRDRERKLIKKIDKTLETIEADEYGFCEDCGIEIGLRRLEARPTATLCIDCKTLAEIKEKQFRN